MTAVPTDPISQAAELARTGRLDEADAICRRVLAQRPAHVPALSLSGLIALRSGRPEEAYRRLSLAAQLDPKNAGSQFNFGECLAAMGRHREAAEAYRRAARLAPRFAPAFAGLGMALFAAGDQADGLDALRRAVALEPGAAEPHINLGVALVTCRKISEALDVLRKAVALAPGHPEAHFNLGAALAESGDSEGAASAYRKALALAPAHPRAANNLGLVLQHQGARREALDLFVQAARTSPAFAEAWYNAGNALKDLGRFAEAEAHYSRALAAGTSDFRVRKNRAHVRLTLGDFAGGWSDYLSREVVRSEPRPGAPLPPDLAGQRILLRREQGVGDEIFFLRFAPLLLQRGADLKIQVDPRLAGMIGRAGIASAVSGDQTAEAFDLDLALGDLPFLLSHTKAAACPPPLPLQPLDQALQRARTRLGPAGPQIAVTWRAGTESNQRQIDPERLGRALREVPSAVAILQRKPGADEIAAFRTGLGREALDLSDMNDDLEDMLALMSLVETYVAVSNTNVHLRASVGRATHVLVPHPPEWRWLATGERSPWFPGSPVYRQTPEDGWDAALAALRSALKNRQV